jgi:hypothetical protein
MVTAHQQMYIKLRVEKRSQHLSRMMEHWQGKPCNSLSSIRLDQEKGG